MKLPWHLIFEQNLGTNVHSAQQLAKTDGNITILIQQQYFSYIFCKSDEDQSSNPQNYEDNNC